MAAKTAKELSDEADKLNEQAKKLRAEARKLRAKEKREEQRRQREAARDEAEKLIVYAKSLPVNNDDNAISVYEYLRQMYAKKYPQG